MPKYRYPTELRHVYPTGMREIEAEGDAAALRQARANGATLTMRNMQIHAGARGWRFVLELRSEIAEINALQKASDERGDYPSHERIPPIEG